MNLTDDEVLKCQKGTPILFKDICAVYPATLGQIVDEGYSVFQQYLGILISEKPIPKNDSEMSAMLAKLTNFQYLLLMASMDTRMNELLKRSFMFFTHEEVSLSLDPPQLVVGPLKDQRLIKEEDFYDFQCLLRHMYFIDVDVEDIVINPNDSKEMIQMKLKMRANREKLRKAKAKKAAQEKTDLQLSDLIGSLTINNCGLNIENIWNITYYAFHDQLKRMGWRDQFNINNKAALAGAKLKKDQLKHWMRSIAYSDKS